MSLKSILFEEDPKKPAPPERRDAPRTGLVIDKIADQTHEVLRSQPMGMPTYEFLRAKTDFAGTDVGAALAKYSEPLAGVIPDEKQRAKAATKLAEKEGISVEKILATFDGLKVALQSEVAKFNAAGKSQEDSIAAKQATITQLTSQMNALQTQITNLGGEISDTQTHIRNVKAEFNGAVNRRSLELDKEKEHYADLLR